MGKFGYDAIWHHWEATIMKHTRSGILFNFLCKTLKPEYHNRAGLSMNILRAGDKSPVQKGFFNNRAGDLLHALSFPGGLYNFCNFVIIFSLM